jgi:hypothetical protein
LEEGSHRSITDNNLSALKSLQNVHMKNFRKRGRE